MVGRGILVRKAAMRVCLPWQQIVRVADLYGTHNGDQQHRKHCDPTRLEAPKLGNGIVLEQATHRGKQEFAKGRA